MPRRWTALLALLALGCDKGEESVPYIDVPVPATKVVVNGPNAYGGYANLAERAIGRAKLGLDARDTAGNRKRALAEVGPLLPELATATLLPSTFLFEPIGPFEERPHQMGWLHLGRALVWRVEQAVEEGDWGAAVHWTVVATTFGADLAGGSVSDATLGYGVMDGVRRAIAPYVSGLPDSALNTLAAGVSRALARMPDPTVTVAHEEALMLTAVGALQEAHKDGKTEDFAKKLYGESRESVRAFAKLRGVECTAFVQSLVESAQRMAQSLKTACIVPASTRTPVVFEGKGDTGAVAKQFFTAGIPWLGVRDLPLARTRLLYLTAYVCQRLRATGTAPDDLGGVEEDLKTDPYTGLLIGYVPLGRDFIVYSYGADGKDDRGDSDAERMRPDLLLEEAAL